MELPRFSILRDGRVVGGFETPDGGMTGRVLKDGAWVPVPMSVFVESEYMGRPLTAEEVAALPAFSATS